MIPDSDRWHTSSYSSGTGECVEVCEGPVTGVRDSTQRELGHVAVPARAWIEVLRAARAQ